MNLSRLHSPEEKRRRAMADYEEPAGWRWTTQANTSPMGRVWIWVGVDGALCLLAKLHGRRRVPSKSKDQGKEVAGRVEKSRRFGSETAKENKIKARKLPSGWYK